MYYKLRKTKNEGLFYKQKHLYKWTEIHQALLSQFSSSREFNWENVINYDSSLNVGESQPRITLRFEAKECQNKLSSVFKSSSPEAWWKTMQGEKVAEIGESQPW